MISGRHQILTKTPQFPGGKDSMKGDIHQWLDITGQSDDNRQQSYTHTHHTYMHINVHIQIHIHIHTHTHKTNKNSGNSSSKEQAEFILGIKIESRRENKLI